MKHHFEQFASYNRWANARLYQAAFGLSDADYRRDVGAFFKSLHGTLNHLLLVDRRWFGRLTGGDEGPQKLNTILYESRQELAAARADEDDAIIHIVSAYTPDDLDKTIAYSTTAGKPHVQKRKEVLAHVFNHQTHHRGQAHTVLSILTGKEPPVLDLLAFQRNAPAPDLRALATAAPV
jgi:uncharacterized damage-inducible protein DinB